MRRGQVVDVGGVLLHHVGRAVFSHNSMKLGRMGRGRMGRGRREGGGERGG